jgi:hypothetical protein
LLFRGEQTVKEIVADDEGSICTTDIRLMVRIISLVAFIWASASSPVLACIESPEVVHDREIALLDAGIKNSKLAAAWLVTARKLRDSAEVLYKAGKYVQALRDRHAALIRIGYRYQEASGPAAKAPRRQVPLVAESVEAGAIITSTTCSDGGRWLAPSK